MFTIVVLLNNLKFLLKITLVAIITFSKLSFSAIFYNYNAHTWRQQWIIYAIIGGTGIVYDTPMVVMFLIRLISWSCILSIVAHLVVTTVTLVNSLRVPRDDLIGHVNNCRNVINEFKVHLSYLLICESLHPLLFFLLSRVWCESKLRNSSAY